jgi:hypothetical protein
MDWVRLPLNMVDTRDFVYREINFRFPKKQRIWLAKVILHSESGLRFVQSVCQL